MEDKQTEKLVYNFKSIEHKWKEKWFGENSYAAQIDHSKPKYYCLDTWAYPSADGVHIGYVKSFGGMDVIARYKRMRGYNVIYPTGWDTLGLPAENYAIKAGKHPREITDTSIQHFKDQFKSFGLSYDWSREINTADPEYYRWTQWLFLVMYKHNLAYRAKTNVNWCPNCKTVLAKEQVIDTHCERCGAEVSEKELMQWFFKVTEYADRLYEDCSKLHWEEKYINPHRKWIGKEVGEDGHARFHVRDWCVSRQRYWGPPIPIIYCETCGTIPVPEHSLPVKLPYEVDFTPTGESPLAKDSSFVTTTCPHCGGSAQRETDTLDTFVSSAWYQFRFMDPSNPLEFAGKEALDYWQNVDHYQGTIEHLTAHLIYARFVTKVLFDHGYVRVDEPFPKYTPVGLLVDKQGEKFSKRLGNAPNTNELIALYGGDLLRLSCYFISSFDDVTRWGEEDIVAVERFRNRAWRIFVERIDTQNHKMPEEILRAMHQMIKSVQESIEQMKFNVAISKIMVFTGRLQNYEGKIDRSVIEILTKVLAPFVPFMAEEMWYRMGNCTSIHAEEWPTYDEKYIESATVEIAVQFNGKVRGQVVIPIDSSEEEVKQIVISSGEFNTYLANDQKIIYVKNRLINFI